MASIIRRPNGDRWIQFTDGNRKRKTIRLGKMTAKGAKEICSRVEELVAIQRAMIPMRGDLASWLYAIPTDLQNKLAAVGLCDRRSSDGLAGFVDAFIAGKTAKPSTKLKWKQSRRCLFEFFPRTTCLGAVTPADADRYRQHLLDSGLAKSTARKRLQFATAAFRMAVRERLIVSNPFDGVTIKAGRTNRFHFVTREEIARVLDACPNQDWRLVFALARFGGLRCPSEVLSLRWGDVDWSANRITVTVPKLEHLEGMGTRVIPMFAELERELMDSWEIAPEGAVYVVDERMRRAAVTKRGWSNCNLRTTALKIVQRAGLEPWPKLFQNMRSTRQTELAESLPFHVVCAWIGNSERVAQDHYLQVTEDHFAAGVALGSATKTTRSKTRSSRGRKPTAKP